MKIATLIELRILDFWELTPYEFNLTAIAYNRKAKQERDERITLAWAGARWQRAKKMPELKEILGQDQKPKQQTAENMLEELKKLNAAFGGTTQ